MAALAQLEDGVRRAPPRPALLVGAARAARALRRPPDAALPRRPARLRGARAGDRRRGPGAACRAASALYLKREDLAHTGAHKINNALGQALLTRRLGKTRVIAETGAGQHGVATATACALLGLPCVVYMGAEDIERQQPNVLRMQALGAEVRPVTSGSATLKDAINDAMRDWVTNVETTHYVLGSAMGPHPVPDDRPRPPAADRRRGGGPGRRGRGPAAGPRAGLRRRRLERDRAARPVHRRAVGPARGRRGRGRRDRDRPARGGARRRHAGDPPRRPLDDAPGPRRPGRRGASRRRPGSTTRASGRRSRRWPRPAGWRSPAATDDEAFEAMRWLARTEGILPALETAHALAALPRLLAGTRGRGRATGPRRRSCSSGSPAAATRTSRRSGGGSRRRDRDRDRRGAAGRDERDRRRPTDRGGVRGRGRAGRAALIPYVVAGYPDAETSYAAALAAIDAGADLLEVGLPYSDPLADGATLQRASPGRAPQRRDARGQPAPDRADRRPRGRRSPLVPMGYANQFIGGGDGREAARRLADAGAAGVIVADLTPDEGGPFEARRPRARPRGRLPRRADDAAGASRRDRRAERRLPLLRVARRRDRRPRLAAVDGRPARPRRRAASPVPVGVGFGVSRPAHVRALAKAGAGGVIVASALVDALGADGRDVDRMAALVREPRATARPGAGA